jgi:hypothetical protein
VIFERDRDSVINQSYTPEIINDAEQLLASKSHKAKLLQLTDNLAKNAQDKATLESGTLSILSAKRTVSQQFIKEALLLAEFFDCNELEAAEYMELGIESQGRLGKSPFESAVISYFSEKLYLTQSIFEIFAACLDGSLSERIRELFTDFADTLVKEKMPSNNKSELTGQNQITFCQKLFVSIQDIKLFAAKLIEKKSTKMVSVLCNC